MTDMYAPNQQVVHGDDSGPAEEGDGGVPATTEPTPDPAEPETPPNEPPAPEPQPSPPDTPAD